MPPARVVLFFGIAFLAIGLNASAASFYLSPDVPADLGGVTRLPWEVVRSDAATYTSAATFPAGTPLDALHRMDSGDWLFSVAWPFDLGGTTRDPRDVLRLDVAGAYTPFFDGAAAGLPPAANVDAAFLLGGDAGDLILSFDAPTTVGGETFEPADLVRYVGGGFDLFFDASASSPSVPPSSNVTGADDRAGLTVLTFDVPTTLGGTTFLPGELVSWNGATFASFHVDPAWPAANSINALALLADPGTVPPTITLAKASTTGNVEIAWDPSCSFGAEDYGIYEGSIGSWYSHTQIDCSDDGGDRNEVIVPASGSRYYLVVPHNPNDEGSYGPGAGVLFRPAGTSTCAAVNVNTPCP